MRMRVVVRPAGHLHGTSLPAAWARTTVAGPSLSREKRGEQRVAPVPANRPAGDRPRQSLTPPVVLVKRRSHVVSTRRMPITQGWILQRSTWPTYPTDLVINNSNQQVHARYAAVSSRRGYRGQTAVCRSNIPQSPAAAEFFQQGTMSETISVAKNANPQFVSSSRRVFFR